MTPEEKAKELVDKFEESFEGLQVDNEPGGGGWIESSSRKEAIRDCALIAANELIKYLPSSACNPPNLQEYESNSEFWEKVKDEIKKQ